MNGESTEEWVSAHLFYNPPWEQMLVEALRPFVYELIDNGESSQFFFVRYWERGPHIRLRMKTNRPSTIRENITSYFSEYFGNHPSSAPINSAEADYPNNSVQFIPYEPEVERYGGPDAILLSEQLFQASSRVVLNLLSEQNWDSSIAAGAALQLHLALVRAFGYSREEAHIFFEPQTVPNGLVRTVENFKALMDSYRYRLLTVNAGITSYCRYVWNSLEIIGSLNDERLTFWMDSAQQIREDLDRIIERGAFFMPEGMRYVFQARTEYSYLLSSHVHMMNNRLGIATVEEPYLNFLLMSALA